MASGAALEQGLPGDQVDYVIMGDRCCRGRSRADTVQQAARRRRRHPHDRAGAHAQQGLPVRAGRHRAGRPAHRGCGEYDIVVAGGMESMSQTPHTAAGARRGFKYGSAELIDSMASRADRCVRSPGHGRGRPRSTTARCASAGRSRTSSPHGRISSPPGRQDGLFAGDRGRAGATARRGDPVIFDTDEASGGHDRRVAWPRSARPSRPTAPHHGRVGVPDLQTETCAVVVMSAAEAERRGATVLAEIGATHGVVGRCPTTRCTRRPSRAIEERHWTGPACRWPTWTWSRSTRHSPLWPSSRCATWPWTPTG